MDEEEAKEKAKEDFDVINIFFLYHGLDRTGTIHFTIQQEQTSFLPWIISSFE